MTPYQEWSRDELIACLEALAVDNAALRMALDHVLLNGTSAIEPRGILNMEKPRGKR